MMKYWLLVFLFTPEGEYAGKDVYQTDNKAACFERAAKVAKTYVNTQTMTDMYCVSDDHYNGRSVDEGIPLDFN